jgi:hypothetical protein
MSYRRFYWRSFNVFARVWGLGFILVGLFGLFQVFSGAAGHDSRLLLAVCAFATAAGVLMLFAKPYRPDIHGFWAAFRNSSRGRQTWWTGEPK